MFLLQTILSFSTELHSITLLFPVLLLNSPCIITANFEDKHFLLNHFGELLPLQFLFKNCYFM